MATALAENRMHAASMSGGAAITWAGLENAGDGASATAAGGGFHLVSISLIGVEHPHIVLLVEFDTVDSDAIETSRLLGCRCGCLH